MKLFVNLNKSTIKILQNLIQHDRTKHIEIKWHFIKENLDYGLIVAVYVTSGCKLTGVLTKGLSTEQFLELTGKLRMIYVNSLLERESSIAGSSSNISFYMDLFPLFRIVVFHNFHC